MFGARRLAQKPPEGKIVRALTGPPFRMPLHGKDRRRRMRCRNGLNDTIGTRGVDDKSLRQPVDRLVVYAVDGQTPAARIAMEGAARGDLDLVAMGKGVEERGPGRGVVSLPDA